MQSAAGASAPDGSATSYNAYGQGLGATHYAGYGYNWGPAMYRGGGLLGTQLKLASGQTCDEAEIKAFCQGQIAHYKVPRYVRFVDGFPMTVTGKIQKFEIRDAMIRELGLRVAETA